MALLLQIYHDALQWHDTLCCVHGLTVCDFAAPPDLVSPNFETVRNRVGKEGERTPSEQAWIPFRFPWSLQNILLSWLEFKPVYGDTSEHSDTQMQTPLGQRVRQEISFSHTTHHSRLYCTPVREFWQKKLDCPRMNTLPLSPPTCTTPPPSLRSFIHNNRDPAGNSPPTCHTCNGRAVTCSTPTVGGFLAGFFFCGVYVQDCMCRRLSRRGPALNVLFAPPLGSVTVTVMNTFVKVSL